MPEFCTTLASMRELLTEKNVIVRPCVRTFLEAHPELPGSTIITVTPNSVRLGEASAKSH